MLLPGALSITPISIAANIVIALAAAILGYEYRNWRDNNRKEGEELENWYEDTERIVSQGIHRIQRSSDRSDIDFGSTSENLDGLAEELSVKCRNAPESVSEKAVGEVHELSRIYAKGTTVAEVSSQKEGIDLLSELFEMAQMEYSQDMDFGQVMEAAGEFSEGFDDLLVAGEKQGIGREEFAEVMEEVFTELDSKGLHLILNTYSQGDQDFEDAVNLALHLFLEIAMKLSLIAFDTLETEKA